MTRLFLYLLIALILGCGSNQPPSATKLADSSSAGSACDQTTFEAKYPVIQKSIECYQEDPSINMSYHYGVYIFDEYTAITCVVNAQYDTSNEETRAIQNGCDQKFSCSSGGVKFNLNADGSANYGKVQFPDGSCVVK